MPCQVHRTDPPPGRCSCLSEIPTPTGSLRRWCCLPNDPPCWHSGPWSAANPPEPPWEPAPGISRMGSRRRHHWFPVDLLDIRLIRGSGEEPHDEHHRDEDDRQGQKHVLDTGSGIAWHLLIVADATHTVASVHFSRPYPPSSMSPEQQSGSAPSESR